MVPPIDPNYAGIKSSGSESDPNYESVNQPDPNYESVKDLEPYYGTTEADKVNRDASDSSSRTTETEPPYERLDSDITGYEKIGSNGSGSSAHEIDPIPNEDSDTNIHDENAVVQV